MTYITDATVDRAIKTLRNAIEAAENSNHAGEDFVAAAAVAPELLEACKAAKQYLVPELEEPGRTVFWQLVDAIAKATGEP